MRNKKRSFTSPQNAIKKQTDSPALQNMLGNAVRLHQSGRLNEAEQLYRSILVIEPNHADSWHLLGVIAYQTHHLEIAVDLIGHAIQMNDKDASYPCNLGLALQAQGKLDEAIARYKQALALNPNYGEACYNLGNAYRDQGNLDEAINHYNEALALKPSYAEAHCNLSVILCSQGNLDEAVAHGEQAIALRPDLAEAYFNLGNYLQAQGRHKEAAAHYKQALILKPDYAAAHCNLGILLRHQHRLDEAVRQYHTALSFQPDCANLHLNLGLALCDQGNFNEAVLYYRRALDAEPDLSEAHYNLGLALCAQDKLNEAVAHYEQALKINPSYAEAHNNLGGTLDARNMLDAAIAHYKSALSLKPELTEARFNLAMSQLRSGDFAAGWHNYEWRWHSEKSPLLKREFSQPQWKGEPLHGARILLHAEQGLGDSIQFLRYLPMVQAAGGVVVLEVQDRLRGIAAELPGIADLVSPGDSLPPFDWHCPLLSLPLAFGTELATIPGQVPYLSIPEQARKDASALPWPTTGLRIGIAWAGNQTFLHDRYRYRSIPFPLLKPLLDRRDVHLFSLQMRESFAEFDVASSRMTDFAPYVRDMADTAAQMLHLDLVISIDTSVAHLAGALGITTWNLLPYCSDWRWLEKCEDSRWYPTMRLFRQPAPGDWESVIDAVRNALSLRLPK